MSETDQRPVLVVDFGAQYAQLIARRVREANVYSEIVPHSITADEVKAKDPRRSCSPVVRRPSTTGAPALDGGDPRARRPRARHLLRLPGHGDALGGEVAQTGQREYGATDVTVTGTDSILLGAQPESQVTWMSHGDSVAKAPEGFEVLASSASTRSPRSPPTSASSTACSGTPRSSTRSTARPCWRTSCTVPPDSRGDWNSANVIEEQVARIKEQVGSARVIAGLSGGVDSAVAAALVHKAVGDQLTCVFVDHGLLRADERKQVEEDYVASTGVRLVTVDAEQQFLDALAGVSDPEQKRKIIGREFIRTFEAAAEAHVLEARADAAASDSDSGEVKFLVQGTLYPDVVESGGGSGTANIKSHHNVGGLPEDMTFELVEPLRTLFKDEVRAVGRELGLPEVIVGRQPFPGRGSASASWVGRQAAAGTAPRRRQDRPRGTHRGRPRRGDLAVPGRPARRRPLGRGPGRRPDVRPPIVLRPVSSEDAMTADWTRLPYDTLAKISNRITNEVPDVNRVVLDVTSKPPGTIEWE